MVFRTVHITQDKHLQIQNVFQEDFFFFNENGKLILHVFPEEQRLACIRGALIDE